MHGLKSRCEDANQCHIMQRRARRVEIEEQTTTRYYAQRRFTHIDIIEMSYAINQNTVKYYQYIDKYNPG